MKSVIIAIECSVRPCFAMPRNFDADCNEFTRTVSDEHKVRPYRSSVILDT